MTDNLPAVRPDLEVTHADTDSWIGVVGDVAKLAGHIAGTEFVPRGLRDSPAAVTAAIIYGREVGLPPMTALTQTYVIEGKPAMSAEAMRGLVLAAGHEIHIEETTGARCVMSARRRGSERWTRIEWSLDMARAANLTGKNTWKSYPRQMLQARCTAELVRLVFPDVIHGFRAVEEFDEGDTGPAGPSNTVGGSSTVQRRTRKSAGTKGEAVVEAPTERPALEGPPLPGEAGYIEPAGSVGEGRSEGNATPDVPAESAPESGDDHLTPPGQSPETVGEETHPGDDAPGNDRDDTPPPRPATKADLRMVQASFKDVLADIDDDEAKRSERLAIATAIAGRIVDTFNDLSQHEARLIADTVARHRSRADLWALLEATTDPA